MENRGIVKLLILSVVTLGIYSILWHFWTTKELKAKGADIPTAWLQIIPLANIFFYFKYYEGSEKVTGGAVSGILYFVLALFVSPIVSMLLSQNEYNKLSGAAEAVNQGAHPGQAQAAHHPQQVAASHAAATPVEPAAAPMPAPAEPQVSAPPVAEPMASAPNPAPAAPQQDVAAPAPAPAPQAPAPGMPQQDVAPPADQNQQPPQNPPLVQ